MSEYKHGSMDTTQSEGAFFGLVKAAAWVSLLTAIVLIFLAIVGT